jgi:hypothetical protein
MRRFRATLGRLAPTIRPAVAMIKLILNVFCALLVILVVIVITVVAVRSVRRGEHPWKVFKTWLAEMIAVLSNVG